jgi:uncharacterized protein YoxC
MKKKIINGIMMVALVAATSTSFVSCKDTNEDVRIEQNAKIDNLARDLATQEAALAALDSKYGGICDALDDRIDGVRGDLTNVQNDLANMQNDLNGVKDDLTDVQNAVDSLGNSLGNDIQNLETAAVELSQEINELEVWLMETFAKLVTSVEISGAYNNMTGSINIPGFEPKMLINNWGVAAEGAEAWPHSKDLNNDESWAWAANDELGTNWFNGGFAGYIYANVNRYFDSPLLSQAFHQGAIYRIDLVNTAGEVADGVVIDNVDQTGAPTSDVLQWGWTRADNPNNIFKLGVGYVGENAKRFQPAKIDLSKLKEEIKAVWRSRHSANRKQELGRLLTDLYYNYATKDTRMAKYALRIAWMDNTAAGKPANAEERVRMPKPFFLDGDEKEFEYTTTGAIGHMSTSEAELVFATMKPLSFNSGEALAEKVDQGVGSVNNLIEKLEPYINKIVERVNKKLNLGQYNLDMKLFDKIEKGDPEGPYAGKWIVKIKNADLVNAGVIKWNTDDIEVNIDDIVEPIYDACESMNKLLKNVQKLLDKNYGNSVTNWVEKYTNKFDEVFANNADQLLQPVLLVIDNGGNVGRASGMSNVPYIASGEVILKPTTYTAELLAPAYGKFVAIKSVDGVAQTKADQEKFGKNFGHILIAGDQELKFTPESGKLYEIVYEAVDFSGNQFEYSYYIQGK